MGFFSRKAKKAPTASVEAWSAADVRTWVKSIGLTKYKNSFVGVTGKDLLAMTKQDVPARVAKPTHAAKFWTALEAVQVQAAPVVEPSAAAEPADDEEEEALAANDAAAAAAEMDGQDAADGVEEELAEEAPAQELPDFHTTPISPGSENVSYASKEVQGSTRKDVDIDEVTVTDAGGAEDEHHDENGGALKWVKSMFSKKDSHCEEYPDELGSEGGDQPAQGAPHPGQEAASTDDLHDELAYGGGAGRNTAEVMAKWAGGAGRLHELTAYFDALGVGSHGLVTAAETAPMVGMIVGALWDLHDSCVSARGNRGNCAQLDAFGQDVLRVFDFRGKRTGSMETSKLQSLFDLICEAVRIVGNCSRPGWLLRMACDERSVEDFAMIHNTILETLRSEGMDQLGNQRRLDYGCYTDASKPLRRKLKQLGSGSVEGGLRACKSSEAALVEVCGLMAVDPMDVAKELEGVTSELDDLATIYTKTVEGNAVEEQLYIRECEDIFDTYDRHRTGALSFDELRAVLGDLGFLDALPASEADAYVLQRFHLVGTTSTINFENFCQFYRRIKMSRARHELRTTLGVSSEYDLKKVFISFASFGTRTMLEEMDSTRFMKLCKDTKLLSRSLTTSDADLVFVRVKVKGSRRINFEQFVQALSMMAERKGKPLDELVGQVLRASGPANTGTKAAYVKFHDDKSTYTGVYARGGPSTTDKNKDLSAYLDRSDADVRGVKRGAGNGLASGNGTGQGNNVTPLRSSAQYPTSYAVSPAGTTPGGGMTPRGGGAYAGMPMSARGGSRFGDKPAYSPVPMTARVAEFPDLISAFRAFATFGAGPAQEGVKCAMDGLRFAKLCRDCDLMDGALTSTTVDLIFTKVKLKGARKISFREFKTALEMVAQAKGVTGAEVAEAVRGSRGPILVGTRAESVRFHDDHPMGQHGGSSSTPRGVRSAPLRGF